MENHFGPVLESDSSEASSAADAEEILEAENENNTVDLKRYYIMFAVTYAVCLSIFMAIEILGIELGSWTNIVSLISATIIPAYKFVEDHQRVPYRAERKKLVIGSLALTWIVSLLAVAILYIVEPSVIDVLKTLFKKEGMQIIMLVILIVLSLVYYLILHFCYGQFTRTRANQLGIDYD